MPLSDALHMREVIMSVRVTVHVSNYWIAKCTGKQILTVPLWYRAASKKKYFPVSPTFL